MHHLLLIISILLGRRYQANEFELKADMKKDYIMFADQHGVFVDKSRLNEFKAYINLDLSKFRFNKEKRGMHNVLKWTSTSGPKLIIYEVKSIIPSDTVYQDKILVWDSVAKKNTTIPGETIKLKPARFTFHTYVIQPSVGKQLVYLTEQHGGLMEYSIGDKIFYPIREDIALGLKSPDIKEILKLLTAMK